MESARITWLAVLVAWPLVALSVAYLFGGFVRRADASESDGTAPELSYLRRHKRANGQLLGSTETKLRRVAGGRRHR